MPPTTVQQALLIVAEGAGTRVGHLVARHPHIARVVLLQLERCGMRGAGWALLALQLGGGR